MFCFSGPMLSCVVSCSATVGSVKPLNRLFATHLLPSIAPSLKSSASRTVSPGDA